MRTDGLSFRLSLLGLGGYSFPLSALRLIPASGGSPRRRWGEIKKGVRGLLFLCTAVLLFFGTAVTSEAFKLPDTGQTKCYQDVSPYAEITCPSPGSSLAQDGSYNINPKSYTVIGSDMVQDNNTGLIWQRQDDGNAYNWYQAVGEVNSSYNPSGGSYKNVCDALNIGGYSDWRLPSKKELITIVDYSIPYPGPTINASYFPNTKQSTYWSSTTYAYYPVGAWYVYFGSGIVNYSDKIFANYVRCVRAGLNACSSPAKHYKCLDGTDGTNQISSPSKWVWTCGTTSCSETKSPGYIEN